MTLLGENMGTLPRETDADNKNKEQSNAGGAEAAPPQRYGHSTRAERDHVGYGHKAYGNGELSTPHSS